MPNTDFTAIVSDSGPEFIVPSNPTPPDIPRNFTPEKEDRYISLVIELDNRATDRDVRLLEIEINKMLCTKLSGYFPELLFMHQNIYKVHNDWIKAGKLKKSVFLNKTEIKKVFTTLKTKKYPRLIFELNRLFPGSEKNFKNSKKFGLHKFLLLSLPIFQRQFEIRTTPAKLYARLYEVCYLLREIEGINTVSPSSQYKRYRLLSSMGDGTNSFPRNWMLKSIHGTAADTAGANGEGIVIGHPDTGWTPHPQLNFVDTNTNPTSPNFDLNRDWNLFNDTNTAEEPLTSIHPFPLENAFHGTSTSSIIISSPNDNLVAEEDRLTGLAPKATILPIRTASQKGFILDTGVVLIGDSDVARAIWYAIQKNVDVISLSLGGYPMPALECVVAHAVYNNIIVVAAAGQIYPFMVFPAAYPECIAVGASNNFDKPWSLCVKKNKIAISAPGEQVFNAFWKKNETSGIMEPNIDGAGNGCSFSTAFVAGAAALWLQKYNKQELISDLDERATLQELFVSHLQLTAKKPPFWDTTQSGAGILNVKRLLDTSTLPDLDSFTGQDWNNWIRRSEMELLYSFYENTDRVVIRERFELMVNSSDFENFMRNCGQEILNLFMGVKEIGKKFGESLQAGTQKAEELREEIVEEAKEFVSDPVGTITGWFSQ